MTWLNKQILLCTVLFIVLLSFTGCNGSPDGPSDLSADLQRRWEALAGFMAATTSDLVGTTYDASLSIPDDATWNGATGWWSFTVELQNGQTADVELQFQNASGQIQQFYRPQTTHRVLTRGRGSGPEGTFTWDLVLTGARASSNRIVANGSGTVDSQEISGTYQVNGLVLLKEPGSYPQGGNVVVNTAGASILVEFNGTSVAQATYSLGVISVTFNINLDTGEVTRS